MTIDNQKHVVSRKFGFSLPPSFSKTEILVQIDFPSLSDSYQISRDIMKITLCSVLVPFATDIVRSEVKPVVRWKIRIIFGRLPTGNLFIGGSKRLPGYLGHLFTATSGDFANFLKVPSLARPQSARLSAGEGAQSLFGQCPSEENIKNGVQ